MNSRWSAALAFGLLVAAGGCKKGPPPGPPQAPPPAPVTAVPATAQDVPSYLDEIGRTVAREVVSIQPQLTGRILEIRFQDGADLKVGDPLFLIDPRPFQAQLAAAEATLAQSRATMDLARMEFARSDKLLKEQAISQQDFDTSQNAVTVAEARVKQDEAALETARLNLEYCTVLSPIEGRAGQRLVDVGNIVEANQTTLLVIQRLDPIYADFTVAEKNLSAVQRQKAKGPLQVEITFADEPGPKFAGELTFVDNAIQERTGTVKLRATVANPERRLWPGRFVKVRLVLETIAGAVLVPATAAQVSAMGPYVFVVTPESMAEMRPVKLGQRQGDLIVIESGVKAGEMVVTSANVMVQPNKPVRVVPPAPALGERK